VTARPAYLIPPLLVGLAVDMKFVLTLLFPNAGAGGGLLTVERGAVHRQLLIVSIYFELWLYGVGVNIVPIHCIKVLVNLGGGGLVFHE